MKLSDLNKQFENGIDKYTVNKAGLNKEIGVGTDDSNPEMPQRSGNQDTPVKKEHQKLLGTNPLGNRDKVMPTNLAT